MKLKLQSKVDEEALIDALKNAGNEKDKYIKQLISQYQGYIYKLHIDTGLNEVILNDLYTDTVMLVLKHIENQNFRKESRLSTYFYKIFYFKTIDYIRQRAVSKIEYTGELPEHRDESQNIYGNLEAQDEMYQIVLLLEKMCPICQQLIMEWAYWGFRPEEIGARIGETNPVKYAKLKYQCIERFKKLWYKQFEKNE